MSDLKKFRDPRDEEVSLSPLGVGSASSSEARFRAAVMRMRCAKCKRQVDRVEILTPMYELVGTRIMIRAYCHGETEIGELVGHEMDAIIRGEVQVREAFQDWNALPAPPAPQLPAPEVVSAEIVPAEKAIDPLKIPWDDLEHPGKCPNCNTKVGTHARSLNHNLPVCTKGFGVWPDSRDPVTGQRHRPSGRELTRAQRENINPRCVNCKGFSQEHTLCVSRCGTIRVLVCQGAHSIWRPDNV